MWSGQRMDKNKQIPNGPGSCYMTPDRVRWLAMMEDAADRYDAEQYREWLELFPFALTDTERIERASQAHAEMHRRYGCKPRAYLPLLDILW